MTKKFQDVQPSLLLFLNRLRSIVIFDVVSKVTVSNFEPNDNYFQRSVVKKGEWSVLTRKMV